MNANSTLTQAADALARLSEDGPNRLNRIIREQFILPELEKVKSLEEARRMHAALGPEFANAFALLNLKKVPAMLKAVGWPAAQVTALGEAERKQLLQDLFGGRKDLPAKEAPKPPAKKAPAPKKGGKSAGLPDVRTLYNEGGTASVHAAIQKLTLQKLKTLVRDQNITASEPAGSRKDDLVRYIQIALKEELGRRGDWIGAISRTKSED